MTEDQKRTVLDAVTMLDRATSNSLDPRERQRWSAERDRISRALWEMTR